MKMPKQVVFDSLLLRLSWGLVGFFMFGCLIFLISSQLSVKPHSRVQDQWREVQSDGPDTIVVAWHARGTESSFLHINLSSGVWSGYTIWSMGPDLPNEVQSTGLLNFTQSGDHPHLTTDQCEAVRKWALALPTSDPINSPESHRLRIIQNEKGISHVRYYTIEHMHQPLESLSRIMFKSSCLTDYIQP